MMARRVAGFLLLLAASWLLLLALVAGLLWGLGAILRSSGPGLVAMALGVVVLVVGWLVSRRPRPLIDVPLPPRGRNGVRTV